MHEQLQHEPALTPQSGWVPVGIIALILLAFSIVGNGDYVSALEVERDTLQARIALLEQHAARGEACLAGLRDNDLASASVQELVP